MADKSLGPVLRQRVVYYKGSNTDGRWKLSWVIAMDANEIRAQILPDA